VSNVLSEGKKQQVIALGQLGWSLRRIEATVHIRRETISGYLRAVGIPVRPPGGWGRRAPAKPANEVITDFGLESAAEGAVLPELQSNRSPSSSACEPWREVIESGISRGRNAKAIWQDMVDDHGFAGGHQSVRRFVGKFRGSSSPEARVVIITAPGEEAQVDYGSGPMVRDPQTGKYRRTRLFVLTLGCSRKSVRFLTFRSSARTWAELHEKAFRRLGGAPRVVVLDNLREGVLTPDVHDPSLNPLYRDVLHHYGAVALLCRVRDPDRKGKVEAGVAHAQKTPLKGLRFESLDDAQAYLDRWEERWADTRIHGITKRQVAVMFAEERPALLPLPVEPFRYYQHGERTVHLDGCVEVEAAYYGAPPGWIGRRVRVQWNASHVRLLDPLTDNCCVSTCENSAGATASRMIARGQHPECNVFHQPALDPARTEHSHAVPVQQHLRHHQRVVRRLATLLVPIDRVHPRKIQIVRHITDKVSQMVLRQPIAQARRQE
jgi:transposase